MEAHNVTTLENRRARLGFQEARGPAPPNGSLGYREEAGAGAGAGGSAGGSASGAAACDGFDLAGVSDWTSDLPPGGSLTAL